MLLGVKMLKIWLNPSLKEANMKEGFCGKIILTVRRKTKKVSSGHE